MSKSQKLPTYTCLRCGHKWHPRTDKKPIACGSCKTPYWDIPPKKKS